MREQRAVYTDPEHSKQQQTRQDEADLLEMLRSSPHRAGHYSSLHPEDRPSWSGELRTRRPAPARAGSSHQENEQEETDVLDDTGSRLPSSSIRYDRRGQRPAVPEE